MNRATYRNGSGYRTIDVETYRVTDNGYLQVQEPSGRRHLFTGAADVHLSEEPTEEAPTP